MTIFWRARPKFGKVIGFKDVEIFAIL